MFRSSCFAAFARPSIYAAKRFSCGPGAERRVPTKQFYIKMFFYDPVVLATTLWGFQATPFLLGLIMRVKSSVTTSMDLENTASYTVAGLSLLLTTHHRRYQPIPTGSII